MSIQRLHADLLRELRAVVERFAAERERVAFASDGERELAKGNARWADGALHDVAAMDPGSFSSPSALTEAIADLLRARSWDFDYDEPTRARASMLAIVNRPLEATEARRWPLEGMLFTSFDRTSRFLVEEGTEQTIGRVLSTACTIRVDRSFVSRAHLRIRSANARCFVSDVGSTSGTFVNQRRIGGETEVGPGDRIELAASFGYELRFFGGRTLRDAGLLDAVAASHLARALLDALAPLHDLGRTHGALAAHRVLRSDQGFELLITGERAIEKGVAMENPLNMPPEVFAVGAKSTPALDVYGVGCLVYAALAGAPPFPSGSIQEQLIGKMRGVVDWPAEWPSVRRDWLGSLLASDPGQRPAVREALAGLERALLR